MEIPVYQDHMVVVIPSRPVTTHPGVQVIIPTWYREGQKRFLRVSRPAGFTYRTSGICLHLGRQALFAGYAIILDMTPGHRRHPSRDPPPDAQEGVNPGSNPLNRADSRDIATSALPGHLPGEERLQVRCR